MSEIRRYRASRSRFSVAARTNKTSENIGSQLYLFFARVPQSIQIGCGIISIVLVFIFFVFQSLPHAHASGIHDWSKVNSLIAVSPTPNQPKKASTPAPASQDTQQVNASASLVRVNQLDPQQYNSTQEYNTWAYSACSAAAMAEVINSYQKANNTGKQYRITDILSAETSVHAITPDLGLLEPLGIDRTVAVFGFQTTWLNKPSIQDLVRIGNSGKPIIISFPPDRWSGGHLLVARGGNDTSVYLADSSRLNMQVMDYNTFNKDWAGFAVVVTPKSTSSTTTTAPSSTNPYSIVGKPTITAEFINKVLVNAGSPAQGKGQAMYNLGVQYGIDPVFALAFFQHESTFGKNGEARTTMSLGNLRCIPDHECIDQDRGGYAKFKGWEDGFNSWYALMRDLYVNAWGRSTIDTIIPKYAPSGDNNNEAAYIASVKRAVDSWRAGNIG